MLCQATEPMSTFLEYIRWESLLINRSWFVRFGNFTKLQFLKRDCSEMDMSRMLMEKRFRLFCRSLNASVYCLVYGLSMEDAGVWDIAFCALNIIMQIRPHDWQCRADCYWNFARERCSRVDREMSPFRHVWQVPHIDLFGSSIPLPCLCFFSHYFSFPALPHWQLLRTWGSSIGWCLLILLWLHIFLNAWHPRYICLLLFWRWGVFFSYRIHW